MGDYSRFYDAERVDVHTSSCLDVCAVLPDCKLGPGEEEVVPILLLSLLCDLSH